MRFVSPEPMTGCWLWEGADDGRHGYGRFKVGRTCRQAHRISYELHKGPIPAGLTLDHLCRTPSCVCPDHLEPVTALENLRRGNYRKGLAVGGLARAARNRAKTHCKHGHAFDAQNTRHVVTLSGNPGRQCKKCQSANAMRNAKKRKLLISNIKKRS